MNHYSDSIKETIYKNKKLSTVIGLVALSLLIIFLLISNRPQATKKPTPDQSVVVEVIKIKKQDYPVTVSATGSVEAVTRSNLVAQVRGEITYVSEKFNNGGEFKKGDTLLRINNKEYIASTSNAEAAYLQAQATHSQEQVNAEQASKDWQRLGFEGKPNDLVLRKPQLQAATAQLTSAKASYESAKLDLQRTRISAPYNGYTINRNVDLGQYVSLGSILGEIYADTGIEVSLPLTQNSYAQLKLETLPEVTLYASFAGITHSWPAQITRADSVFDPTTRQINAVAKVKNATSDQGLELKVGQFVNASIIGRIAKDVVVIPNSSIREGNYVFLFADGQLQKQDIFILWQDENNSIVQNLQADEQLVLTSLSGVANGTKAKIADKNTIKDKQP